MITGTQSKDGQITITFNSQTDKLCAPGENSHHNKHYLLCDKCHKVEAVEWNVIAFLCNDCSNAKQE